jgi:hypothetical protein
MTRASGRRIAGWRCWPIGCEVVPVGYGALIIVGVAAGTWVIRGR